VRGQRANRFSNPEIGDHRATIGQQYVLRLDVAMHDVLPMRVGERAGDVANAPPLTTTPEVSRSSRRSCRSRTRYSLTLDPCDRAGPAESQRLTPGLM